MNRRRVPGAEADPERLAWWRAFDAAHARAETHLRRALLEQHDLPLAWYRVLDVLAQDPTPHHLGEVAQRLGVPLSSLSRQVDRMVDQMLVTAQRGSDLNHRHVMMTLTSEGKQVWKRATTTLRQTLRRQVLAGLDPTELGDEVERAAQVAPS